MIKAIDAVRNSKINLTYIYLLLAMSELFSSPKLAADDNDHDNDNDDI
jgi:hypothetical protein